MEKDKHTKELWRQRLTPEQYRILRKEGTERAFSSPLHDKKKSASLQILSAGLPS